MRRGTGARTTIGEYDMSKVFVPRLRAAATLCLAGLLAACGGNTDPHARTPQPSPGVAGASGSGPASAASNGGGASDAGNSSNPGGSSSDTGKDGSNAPDREDSSSDASGPKIPDGTLTYTIVLSGHSVVDTSGKHDVYDVARKLQVTSKMHGSPIAAGLSAAPTMDALNKKIEACNGDESCERSVAMGFAMQHRDALTEDSHRTTAAVGRDWLKATPCTGTASVDDTGNDQWKGWDTQLNGRISKQGTKTFDCNEGAYESDFDHLELAARTDTHSYTLTLPSFKMEARYTFGDKPPTTELVNFPGLVIKDQSFTTLDVPLHGSVTLRTGDGSGNELYDPEGPLTAKVDWTFTPDKR